MLDLERAVWAENWTQTDPELDLWSPSCLPPPAGGFGIVDTSWKIWEPQDDEKTKTIEQIRNELDSFPVNRWGKVS